MYKILHITSAHERKDVRIFHKQVCSLARNGYRVGLIAADGLGPETCNGIRIIDAGKPTGGRLKRMTTAAYRVFKAAKSSDADLVQIHDPELIPWGVILKLMGFQVIFDAHEDLPKQIRDKNYLPKYIRPLLSNLSKAIEAAAFSRFDAILSATPSIHKSVAATNPNTYCVNNFPILGEFHQAETTSQPKTQILYAGAISAIRGIFELLDSLSHLSAPVPVTIAGSFSNVSLENRCRSHENFSKVNYLGQVSRETLKEHLGKSIAGLVTFLPKANHIEAQPNKMFEYMSAGIPVISSNFPVWKNIVEKYDCGICVDPTDPQDIARAISRLATNPKLAAEMGRNGRAAIESKFNWNQEEKELLKVYQQTLRPSSK